MSSEKHHAHGGSHSPLAAARMSATPGKRTQVELLQEANAKHDKHAPHAPGGGEDGADGDGDHDHKHKEPKAEASSANPSGVSDMAALKRLLVKHEGYRDVVYADSLGNPTGGIGHLLSGTRWRIGQKISKDQIDAWFRKDVAEAITGARQDIGTAGWERMDDARKMVVVDMVFNMGAGPRGFGGFHRTIQAIRDGRYAEAAKDMLESQWASQVHGRAPEDAAIMRSGHLAGGGGTDGGKQGGGGSGSHGTGSHGTGSHGTGSHGTGSHGTGSHGTGSHHNSGGGASSTAAVRDGNLLLRVGSTGPAVARVQHLLNIPADGIFGPQTLHAVEQFQQAHHLEVDGIVGPHTMAALDRVSPPKHHAKKPHNATGGAEAPSGGDGHDHKHDHKHGGDGDTGSAHGKWEPAPPLKDVEDGTATLHEGQKGGSVRHVQKLLAVDTDGEFGSATRHAVLAFEHAHHMERHDGVIDAHTLRILTKHPVGSLAGESRNGSAQRARLLGIARSGSAGRHPDGMCYLHVCHFLVSCKHYGKITNPYVQFNNDQRSVAHKFADLMNSQGPRTWGLERLGISNPYDAPSGSIVVVKAGSPGTAHPTAGDIAVADGHGHFYNGGEMGYSGRQGWERSPTAHLLGCYVPL